MNKLRLDKALVQRGLVSTRSQAENYIKLGYVQIEGKTALKSGEFVAPSAKISLTIKDQYVSRAALKLASVADRLKLDFRGAAVLDVGSSTGGFSDYALHRGAKKVIAVDVGADQMHISLRNDPRVELHEHTDIREIKKLTAAPDIVLIDVSFISLAEILPTVAKLVGKKAIIVAMCKPQFEAGGKDVHKGVIKNAALRRSILKNFEDWARSSFVVLDKADSAIAGAKGNLERFYLLRTKT